MEVPFKKKDSGWLFYIIMIAIIGLIILSSKDGASNSNNTYVKPHQNRTVKMLKRHVRKNVSTSPNPVKKQNYSKGYNNLHKYRYLKSKKD